MSSTILSDCFTIFSYIQGVSQYILHVACNNMTCRWMQKWQVRTRSWRLNRTPNIRIRNDLAVVKNDISNRFYVLLTNKKRVKILEILWDFRGDSVISKNIVYIKQVQTLD